MVSNADVRLNLDRLACATVIAAFVAAFGPASIAFGQERYQGRSDGDCAADEQLLWRLEGVAVYARCDAAPEGQIMRIAVENHGEQSLTGFGFSFCGNPIVGVSAAPDWNFRRSQEVYFEVFDKTLPVVAGARVDGFAITLTRPWMRSLSMKLQWVDSGAIAATTHDCES